MFVVCVLYACSSSNSSNSNSSDESNEKKIEFSEVVANGDFAEAHKLLNEEIAEISYSTKDKVINNINLLYKAEAIEMIANDSENAQTKLPLLLLEYPMLGQRVNEGLQRYSAYNDHNLFNISLAKFNSLCDDLLASAIALKKFELAQVIIDSYKEDCNVFKGSWDSIHGKYSKYKGVEVDREHSYIEYSWDSKNAAKKKLTEAMKQSK